jgi:hypothetical protein
MDFKQHFERAWKVLTGFFVPLLVNTVVLFAVSVITLGIMAPVASAGYMQSLLLALREERKPEVKDLFAHMNLFFPLLGFTVLFVLAFIIGLIMLVLPGIALSLAATFFLTYMVPLMTDEGLGLFPAVKESCRMALEKPVSEHFAVVAVFTVLASIGSATGIGALLTHPYACLFVLSAYEEKRRRQIEGPKTAPPPPPGK